LGYALAGLDLGGGAAFLTGFAAAGAANVSEEASREHDEQLAADKSHQRTECAIHKTKGVRRNRRN
jgi:hypothetical protein